MEQSLEKHWEKIYQTKQSHEVSWTQDIPVTSIDFIKGLNLKKDASIIDIGGGDSKLVDYLLKEGYTNLSVLDISSTSLDRAKKRLGPNALTVNWIVSDIKEFKPTCQYDVWHDRAAFHFLTNEHDVRNYLKLVRNYVNGYLIIGTFSTKGPDKCSGLPVKQYNEEDLTTIFSEGFEKISCTNVDHITPSRTNQNFTFCSFKNVRNKNKPQIFLV